MWHVVASINCGGKAGINIAHNIKHSNGVSVVSFINGFRSLYVMQVFII